MQKDRPEIKIKKSFGIYGNLHEFRQKYSNSVDDPKKVQDSKDIDYFSKLISLLEIGKNKEAFEILRNIAKSASSDDTDFHDSCIKYFKGKKDQKSFIIFLEELIVSGDEATKKFAQINIIEIIKSLQSSRESSEICYGLINIIMKSGNDRYRTELLNYMTLHVSCYNDLLTYLKSVGHAVRIEILGQLIPFCVERHNALLLGALENEYSDDTSKIIEKLKTFQKNSAEKLLIIAKKYGYYRVNDKNTELLGLIDQFVDGFDKIEFKGGLLAFAALSQKKYLFKPVLLNDQNDFSTLLRLLKSSTLPAKETIVLTGLHWTTIDISIDKAGHARVLFLDSLGDPPINKTKLEILATQVASEFPKHSIYYSRPKRQHAYGACASFSLDDARRLHTLDRHLDLYDFLASQKKESITVVPIKHNGKETTITYCDPPLPLMRTMQSTDLINDTIPHRSPEEQKLKANKKEKTPMELTLKDFENNGKNPINTRLSYLLGKWACRIYTYILTHSREEIDKTKELFTISGAKTRLTEGMPKEFKDKIQISFWRHKKDQDSSISTEKSPIAITLPSPSSLPESNSSVP